MTDKQTKIDQAKKVYRQQRILGWFWYGNIPFDILAYLVLDRETFVAASLLYLTVVSVWALGISHHSRAEAAKAEIAGYENP